MYFAAWRDKFFDALTKELGEQPDAVSLSHDPRVYRSFEATITALLGDDFKKHAFITIKSTKTTETLGMNSTTLYKFDKEMPDAIARDTAQHIKNHQR